MNKKTIIIFFSIVFLLILLATFISLFFYSKKQSILKPLPSTLPPTLSPTPAQELTTDLIFDHSLKAKTENLTMNKNQYLLLVTGDIIPARSVNYFMVKNNNFNLPFEKTADILKKSDIVFANLESPLIPNCPVTNEGMIFCGSERAVSGFVLANINVVNIANNHMGNQGKTGIDNTIRLLNENNILVTGNNQPAIKTVRGKTFGFLGYNTIGYEESGISWVTDNNYQITINNLRSQVNFVIVTFHWGDEYTDKPNERQIELAHQAIDAGADLVVGNHPHWIQSIEFYKGKLISYAHGNFIFDQMWSQETREGVIGAYIFDEKQLVDVFFIPVIIENYSQPRLANQMEKEKILEKMKKASAVNDDN